MTTSHDEMLLLTRSVLSGQFGASLRMLLDAITHGASSTWDARVAAYPFWHVSYHVLFYTDLYLSESEGAFQPRPFHRAGYNWLGFDAAAQRPAPKADQPFDPATLQAYAAHCQIKARECIAREDAESLAGPSGFAWLPFTRLEVHLYNLRHIQHHTGQLNAVLRQEASIGAPWVGTAAL